MRVTIFSSAGEIPPCFDFYVVTRSYSSRPFLCALAPIESHSPVEVVELYYKHRIPATCLATITYVLHSTVTNLSAGNKLRPVLNFTLLIAVTLATRFLCASPNVCLQELIVHQLGPFRLFMIAYQSSHVGLLELKIYQSPCLILVEVRQQLATLFTLGYTLKPVEFIINSPEVCGKHHNFIKSCKYKIRIGNKHVSICNPHSKSPAWTSTTCTSPSHTW